MKEYTLRSPKKKYRAIPHYDYQLALQLNAVKTEGLLERITELQNELDSLGLELIDCFKSEAELLSLHCQAQVDSQTRCVLDDAPLCWDSVLNGATKKAQN